MSRLLQLLCTAGAVALPMVSSAATVIASAAIPDPLTETFEGATPGTILASDPIFAALGIVGITFIEDVGDSYESRANSSRALAASGGSLAIVDPGATGGLLSSITLTFGSAQTFFGMGFHDQGGTYNLTFRNGGSVVDSHSASTTNGPDLEEFALSVAAFDEVTFDIGGGGISGFALDNLTVSAVAAVPLPATLPALLFGVGALGLWRRRKVA